MNAVKPKRTIVNNSGSGHYINFMVYSEGAAQTDFRRLRSGESSVFEAGDTLIIMNDRRTNYSIRTGGGTLLFPYQVNNNHPDYPDQTVIAYKLRLLDAAGEEETEVRSTSDDDGGSGGGDIVITDPSNPHP